MSCWNWFRPGDQMLEMQASRHYCRPDPGAFATSTPFPRTGSSSPVSPPAARWRRSWANLPGPLRGDRRPLGPGDGSANDVMSAFTAMRGNGVRARRPRGAAATRGNGAEADSVSWRRRHDGPPFECRADHRGPRFKLGEEPRSTEHGPCVAPVAPVGGGVLHLTGQAPLRASGRGGRWQRRLRPGRHRDPILRHKGEGELGAQCRVELEAHRLSKLRKPPSLGACEPKQGIRAFRAPVRCPGHRRCIG